MYTRRLQKNDFKILPQQQSLNTSYNYVHKTTHPLKSTEK